MDVTFEIDGEEYKEFNEADIFLMEAIAEDVQLNYVGRVFKVGGFTTHSETAHNLADEQLQEFIDVVDDNLGDLYVKYRGNEWKDDKEDEMTEPGLLMVWFKDDLDDLVGYMSFKLCVDDDGVFVLYLFEIQLVKKYQGQKFGRQMIDQFHELTKVLQKSPNKLYQKLEGTALTVFSDNKRALKWYQGMDYKLTEGSPVDKKLRSGKVVKPEYYLMRRGLD
ncbi:hypothetical protein Cantr_07048 [Candida viswanathii]|uniref:N-alpha-acetyltransferase 40 n=1 Tax=Candida viswanathii TaxID=5486 RepID=A0A367Y0J8_9ASCO|nr:hypothetical protein Cantr_07048 [Candida viswanathii]